MSPAKYRKTSAIYPRRAIDGLAFLFRRLNDLDVFVEDMTCRNMYEVLINRILDNKAHVNHVFQIGCRQEVIDACTKNQKYSKRKQVYIIDGDYDAIVEKRVAPKLKKLYQLKVYCSENLLLCENAVHEVGCECLTNLTKPEIKKSLNFEDFVNEFASNIKSLLMMYLVVWNLNPSLKTMGYNITSLTEQKNGFPRLSPAKVDNRISLLKSQLLKTHSQKEIDTTIKKLEKLMPTDNYQICKYISGKTYILPMLNHYMRENAFYAGTLDQLKVRLARHCRLDIDPDLIFSIRKTAL